MRYVVAKKDLRRETYRGSGPGGQHRNKTETAVRYTHIPTGIRAQASSERSQDSNDKIALAMLLGRLKLHFESIRDAEKSRRKPAASFGNQVRSYILDGQRRVVDHRTGRTGDPNRVLKGLLDEFLRPYP